MDSDFVNSANISKRDLLKKALLAQFVLLLCIYTFAPGYIIPFLHNPLARMCLIYAFLWQTFGIALYGCTRLSARNIFLSTLQTVGFIVIFMLPPSCLIILESLFSPHPQHLDAIGPTMNGFK